MAEERAGVFEGATGDGPGETYSEARERMLERHHEQTLWVPWTILVLGVWTALAPFCFGYLNESLWVDPSGGRGAWFSERAHTELRAWLMTWSDVASGLALVALGWRALRPNRPVSLWLACGIGAWLSAAPIVFWAPTAAAYMNGTLVGMLVIALTILVPGMPNMILHMRMGPAVPPGWTYNPSSWPQRWILIATGLAGLLASRYLAMYQLGYVGDVWDPFFGESSRRVLDSAMSHALPISDAGLGAYAYTFEFLMGYMGGPARWRTMPWMVALFGILVIPLGLVHIALVISQPLVVGHWCTFCLVAAGIMLPMIPLEVDEVVAMAQHVKRSVRRGTSFRQAFWKGGPPSEEATEDERSPRLVDLPREPRRVLGSSLWGVSAPWNLALSAVLGLLAMAAPALFGLDGPSADALHLGGALALVCAVVGMSEPLRAGRYLNVLVGLSLALLPGLLGSGTVREWTLGLALGLPIAALALRRGPIREHYGDWDALIV